MYKPKADSSITSYTKNINPKKPECSAWARLLKRRYNETDLRYLHVLALCIMALLILRFARNYLLSTKQSGRDNNTCIFCLNHHRPPVLANMGEIRCNKR